jgi:hypothetical protein
VDYNTIRDEIKSGDLIALTHTKIRSWYDLKVMAVRFFTKSEYCHVGIAHVYAGRVWLIESVMPKIRMVPLSLMADGGFYWVPSKVLMTEPELEFLVSHIGKGDYSQWQAILAQLNHLKNGADELWECAEFVISGRWLSGADLGGKATPSAVIRAAQDDGDPVFFVSKQDPVMEVCAAGPTIVT